MTEERINVAIAKSLGRTYHKPSGEELKSGSYYQYQPNYTGDLNAMHAVVMQATVAVRKQMRFWLYEMTDQMSAHDATARQRAEAYLRSIGKWEE